MSTVVASDHGQRPAMLCARDYTPLPFFLLHRLQSLGSSGVSRAFCSDQQEHPIPCHTVCAAEWHLPPHRGACGLQSPFS